MKRHLWLVMGTRPEAIKMAPVAEGIRALHPDWEVAILFTQQQASLGLTSLHAMGLPPTHLLTRPPSPQDHDAFAQQVDAQLTRLMADVARPSAVLVQGDTSSALGGARFAHRHRIPLIHQEAGLRTHDPTQPFPEEIIRSEISRMARLHLATTAMARDNLLAEGVPPGDIVLAGNTLATLVMQRFKGRLSEPNEVLVTCHRRETRGRQMVKLANHVLQLAARHPQFRFRWLLHPTLDEEALALLSGGRLPNLRPEPPLGFVELMEAYRRSVAIITDSGGMQEEALCMGIPTLVYRKCTERPECLQFGTAILSPPAGDSFLDDFEQTLQLNPSPRPDAYLGKQAVEHVLAAVSGFVCSL